MRPSIGHGAVLAVPLLSLACAAAPPPRPASPDPCVQVASDQARLPPEAWVEKIDTWLVHDLIAWRRDLAYARCMGSDDRADPDRRVSVEVEYAGEDLQPLRDAGLETGFDRGGVVSGLVHMRALEALARVPAVVRIHAEPPSEPTAAHSRGHDSGALDHAARRSTNAGWRGSPPTASSTHAGSSP